MAPSSLSRASSAHAWCSSRSLQAKAGNRKLRQIVVHGYPAGTIFILDLQPCLKVYGTNVNGEMRIAHLAKQTGTTPSMLRYYESRGLLEVDARPRGRLQDVRTAGAGSGRFHSAGKGPRPEPARDPAAAPNSFPDRQSMRGCAMPSLTSWPRRKAGLPNCEPSNPSFVPCTTAWARSTRCAATSATASAGYQTNRRPSSWRSSEKAVRAAAAPATPTDSGLLQLLRLRREEVIGPAPRA